MSSTQPAMPSSEPLALVALLRRGKRSSSDYAELLEEGRSPTDLLEEDHGLLAPELVEEARAEVLAWLESGIRPVSVLDADYPENLRAVYDRPPLLFSVGKVEPSDAKSVAVIGSRKASATGIARAEAIVEHLVAGGYAVVSGLASGIDTAAHATALERGGRTVAVLGTGLQHVYPPENCLLQERIAADGLLVSQFWPEVGPSRRTFPLRNAVMSGVALATVVVEAGQRSGARIQARQALAHGRPVLIADALLEQPWAAELAARPGVHVVASAAEVTEIVDRFSTTDTLVP